MKTIKKENDKKKEMEFPCLMVNPDHGTVILATAANGDTVEGMIIHEDNHERAPIGLFSHVLNGKKFVTFHGQVILSND